jgi:class 3 adenylate cyclase
VREEVGRHRGRFVKSLGDGALAVHIGARVSKLAAPGEVLIGGTVRDLIVGSGQTLTARGEHDLKGVPGTWRIFAVEA